MRHCKPIYKHNRRFNGFLLRLFIYTICIFFCNGGNGQSCPPNIDFETGTFDNWRCYTGIATTTYDGQNIILLSGSGGPMFKHQTMYPENTTEVDPYGNFPVLCPNGSGHSIKLGSTEAGGEAEGVSYEFTIPQNKNSYSITYHYAIVFQSPHHKISEQPRMEIQVSNTTDNKMISCGSYSFIADQLLPGFKLSDQSDTTLVYFKSWTAVTVDLSGNAGKTIQLFFKTADCTFSEHFAYGYVDVDSDCDGGFIGTKFCADDTVVRVTAPSGYTSYTWYDSSLTDVLGKKQTLTLSPPPVSGTTVAVKLDPFITNECPKTLYTYLESSLVVKANAGRDTFSCNLNPVPVGTIPKQALAYKWTPVAGLNDAGIANPHAAPDTTTLYIVTAKSRGGGCSSRDTVVVKSLKIDTSVLLTGKPAFCFGYGDSAVLNIHREKNIQWFMNDAPVNAARDTVYRATRSGVYYALLDNGAGCNAITSKQTITIDTAKAGISYPVQYAIVNMPLTLEARKIGTAILWRPATSLDTAISFTPVFKGIAEQVYTIEIQTNGGCVTVDTQLVKTIKSIEIYVPNAFTPNNDGLNDFLRPIVRGLKQIDYFKIFDRAGRILFESRSAEHGWDGTFKGMPQQSQLYVWILRGIGVDSKVYAKKGSAVLLR